MRTKIENLRQARSEQGFTLVELLIVIVVLGVLAGITVFGVAAFKADAQKGACEASAKTVSVAADAFNAKTGAYPADMTVLATQKYIESVPNGVTYTAATGEATCP